MTPVMAAPARDPRMQDSEDTEITLGTGKMLALFFGLVILCATFFGMGYSSGRMSAKSSADLLPSPSTSSRGRVSPSSNNPGAPASQPGTGASQPESQPNAPDASTGASPAAAASTSDQAAPIPPPQPGSGYFVQVAAVS